MTSEGQREAFTSGADRRRLWRACVCLSGRSGGGFAFCLPVEFVFCPLSEKCECVNTNDHCVTEVSQCSIKVQFPPKETTNNIFDPSHVKKQTHEEERNRHPPVWLCLLCPPATFHLSCGTPPTFPTVPSPRASRPTAPPPRRRHRSLSLAPGQSSGGKCKASKRGEIRTCRLQLSLAQAGKDAHANKQEEVSSASKIARGEMQLPI